ncbi:hypothetical protein FHS59_002093 [Algoriphagus iocasae]|uniref:Cardiolipin synthase N-terminal domain-containing protein n=1 Tax=Algoriphagus iocasae TaxID=1836499 RepID=A0A841MVF3_9BACT|nr:PLD nuclease N-terminal domain-containing protein [Algoriphagus iocasae]MBB6326465.1 hypothetical protein [Algoriphagus iocasae]
MTFLLFHSMNAGFFGTLFFLFGFIYFCLWVYCLVDIIRSEFKDPNMKLIWILIILFAQVIGPIAYLIMRKGTKST